MRLDLARDPIVEAMCGAVHHRREAPAVEMGGVTALLHALDDEDVLFEHGFPQLGVAHAQPLVAARHRIVEVNVLDGALWPLRLENDGKGVVAVHAQEDVGIGRDILGLLVPFRADILEIGEFLAVLVGELAVNHRALTGILAGFFDVVMVLELGIAVESGMHPGQVVALAVILDREFPVGLDFELEPAVVAAVIERQVEFGPAGDEVGHRLVKRRGVARDVDPDDIAPDMAADLVEAKLIAANGLVGVVPRPADMRRGDKRALGRVAPGMIGAANGTFDLAGFLDEDHAAMSADVLKDPDVAVLVTDQQQRHAEKFQRLGIARLGDIGGDGEPGPLAEQQRVLFFLIDRRVDVMRVGQPVGLFDACAHAAKIGQRLGHLVSLPFDLTGDYRRARRSAHTLATSGLSQGDMQSGVSRPCQSPRDIAATPVRAISTRPKGRINSAKASIFSGAPVISKTKLECVLSTALARKVSARRSASTRLSPSPSTFRRASSRSTLAPSTVRSCTSWTGTMRPNWALICSITCGVPVVTMVMREVWPVWSTSATVRLSIL